MKELEIRRVLDGVCKELDARNAARKAMVPAALMGASLALLAVGCSSSDSTPAPTPPTDNDAGSDAQPDQQALPDADSGPQIEYGGPWDADSGPQVDYMAPDAGDQDVDAGPQPEYMAADAGVEDVDSGPQMDYGAPQDK